MTQKNDLNSDYQKPCKVGFVFRIPVFLFCFGRQRQKNALKFISELVWCFQS